MLRYVVSGAARDLWSASRFPVGALLVNLLGCLVIGAVSHLAEGRGAFAEPTRTCRIERLSEDLPVVVDIVDTRERVESFMATIDEAVHEGLATLEKAQVSFYRPGGTPRL